MALNQMPEVLKTIGLLVLGSILSFAAVWFWKRRDRIWKAADDLAAASRAENKELAKDLADVGRATAKDLELVRQHRSDALELDQKALVKRIEALEIAMTEIKTPVELLWAVVQAKLIKDLTHPSPQFHEMDQLMRELKTLEITEQGRARLAFLMDERIVSGDPQVGEEEKVSARLMKDVLAIESMRLRKANLQ